MSQMCSNGYTANNIDFKAISTIIDHRKPSQALWFTTAAVVI